MGNLAAAPARSWSCEGIREETLGSGVVLGDPGGHLAALILATKNMCLESPLGSRLS